MADEGQPDDDLPVEPVQPIAHARPATVTDFPVRPHTPAAVALPTLPAGTATLVDLIERRGGLDWREAVAVIHQICLYLKDHSPQSPILLDPRTIQITERGEVHLLSGQTSSDPLVIQVGRLLRTMLMGKEAPPELRLLLSQATFELPIFESIEDVDRALAQLNKLDEPGPAGLALLRAVAAPPPPPTPAEDFGHRPPAIRSILPMQRNQTRRARGRTSGLGSLFGSYASHVAVIFAAIAVIGVLLLTRPAMLFPSDALATTSDAVPVATASVPVPEPEAAASAPATPPGTGTPVSREPGRRASSNGKGAGVEAPRAEPSARHQLPRPPSPPPVRRPTGRDGVGVVTITPLEGRPTDGDAIATSGRVRPPAVTPTPSLSPRESQRRAAELLRQGEADGRVQSVRCARDFEPALRAADIGPEPRGAGRVSHQSEADPAGEGSARLRPRASRPRRRRPRPCARLRQRSQGDHRPPNGVDTPPQLREQLNALIAQATEAIATTNEIVYTEADTDVVPPRQLTTQMPITRHRSASHPIASAGWT